MGSVIEASERNKAEVSLESRNFLGESIAELDESIRPNPRLAPAYYDRAQAYCRLGRFQETKQDCDRAVNLDPEAILFYITIEDLYLAMGQPEPAVEPHNQAISWDPKFALAYYNWGVEYIALGQRTEAILDYDHAVILDGRIRLTNNIGVRCKLYDDLYPKDVANKTAEVSPATRLGLPRYSENAALIKRFVWIPMLISITAVASHIRV